MYNFVGFWVVVFGSGLCIIPIINFLILCLKKTDYGLKALIIKQKLELRTAGLKPAKIERVERVIADGADVPENYSSKCNPAKFKS